jgi:ABC-type transporter Mla maintaining outer membrane lipid asymmetry ATPase subunit MlaF
MAGAAQAVVAKTMDSMKATRTTIAHRLSTVRNADRICVLERGKLVETGTYDELMTRNSALAVLARPDAGRMRPARDLRRRRAHSLAMAFATLLVIAATQL